MTSRSVRPPDSTPDPAPAAGPGDRPHLPPVARGSSRRTDRKTPLGWLPWLLLGLLLLTLLAVALLARAAGGTATGAGAGTATGSGDRAVSAPQDGSAGAAANRVFVFLTPQARRLAS